jgi:uncharacterized membrane protein YtjA (UPF0391 family)
MFRLALLFLISALSAGLCGFGAIADLNLASGQLLFVLFLVLAALTFVVGLRDRGSFGDSELRH